MKITLVGKFAILLLLVGCAVGAWKVFGTRIEASVPGRPHPENPSEPTPTGSRHVVTILASSTHAAALKSLEADYERSQTRYSLKFSPPKETRKALHTMLDEGPNSIAGISGWMASCDELGRRFADAYREQWHQEAVNLDDPDAYRVITTVPVAVLARRGSEARVRDVFSSPNPWQELAAGKLRWSFANPVDSSSGTLVLGWALWGFGQTTSNPNDLAGASKSAGFKDFLGKLRRNGFVDAPEGSRSHAETFVSGSLDADCILNYASTLQSSANSNPDFVLVYPSRTVFARHVFSVLQSGSVDDQAGAKDFLRYLVDHYPKMAIPSGVSPVSIPKYYPYLNNAEIAWDAVSR